MCPQKKKENSLPEIFLVICVGRPVARDQNIQKSNGAQVFLRQYPRWALVSSFSISINLILIISIKTKKRTRQRETDAIFNPTFQEHPANLIEMPSVFFFRLH
jgi:hypothetical protein